MILCAAMKVSDERFKPDGFVVVPCWRHGLGYSLIHTLTGGEVKRSQISEGFIDNKNQFLNRTDAFQHALDCGQLSASTRQLKSERNENELYSEDLY